MRIRFGVLFFVAALVLCSCATPGRDSFEEGQGLARVNRLEDAISMYEDAIAKEPNNTVYIEALSKEKATLSERYMEKARSMLARKPLTYDDARAASQEAEKALRLTPQSSSAQNLARNVKSEMDNIVKKAETLYSQATKAMERNEWVDSVNKLREIKRIYPSYLDASAKLSQAERNAMTYYFREIGTYKSDEDWDKVIKNLTLAQEILPGRNEITEELKQAKLKHNSDYYMKKAEAYAAKKEWDMAVKFAQKAYDMRPGDAINQKIAAIKQEAASHYLTLSRQYLLGRKLSVAYTDLMKAITYDPALRKAQSTESLISQLSRAMTEKAAAYETAVHFGNALMWYEKVININPDNQEAFSKIQNMKEKLKERVIKKIAIMDFASPQGKPDAGKIVTDSLLAYITNHASSDVKILARDVLGAIIKEIELGQAGIIDIESAKKVGRIKGTDVFITGSVLIYNVDVDKTEGQKSVNVVVGKKSHSNPEYQMWYASLQGRQPSVEQRQSAPQPYIEEEIRETVKYKVGTGKKRATVAVSFRVIDVEEGEVVITKTIKKPYEVKDDFSEGVEYANIKYDPLELPSDSEVLEKVTQIVTEELSYEVLSRFQNLQVQYFNAAELIKKRREYERAIEKYVDVIQIEEIKNISGPLSENARKEIDSLLSAMGL